MQRQTGSEVVDLLEQSPLGAEVWVRGTGRSMAPLLKSGDALKVQRSQGEDVSVGDLALVRFPGGRIALHLVTHLRPLRTATFLGRADAPGATLLGRVVALRRGHRVLPLSGRGRALIWALHRVAAFASARWSVRVLARATRALGASPLSSPLRRWLWGEVAVRALTPEDLDALLVFAGDSLSIPGGALRAEVEEAWRAGGLVAGAFDGRGRCCGFAVVQARGWLLRCIGVAPWARRMGVGRRLSDHLCAEAGRRGALALAAEVPAWPPAALALLASAGFAPASGGGILERRLEAGPSKRPGNGGPGAARPLRTRRSS